MMQEDLENLHGMLRRMDPNAKISINHYFICSARELDWVVEEALAAREQAKVAGTYEPFRSSVS
jgi:hypothetical protein